MGELVQTNQPLTVSEVKEQVQVIQQVLGSVMKKGTHYDTIKGCGEKSVLLKPGAEKILSTFRIGVESIVEDLGDGYDFRYRVTCRGFHIPTGNTVGYGVGECSSAEKKYAWRESVCEEEFEATPESRRQVYWFSDYRTKEAKSKKQVRQNPADLANTILKMAKKRAMVDLCLTATAASDVFEQDLDEDHIREAAGVKEQPTYQQPQRKSEQAATGDDWKKEPISEGKWKRLYAISKSVGMPDDMLHQGLLEYGFNSTKEVTNDVYDEIISRIESYKTSTGQDVPL